MNIKINIYVIYHLQTHIYENKTDLNMRTIFGKKKVKLYIFFSKNHAQLLILTRCWSPLQQLLQLTQTVVVQFVTKFVIFPSTTQTKRHCSNVVQNLCLLDKFEENLRQ